MDNSWCELTIPIKCSTMKKVIDIISYIIMIFFCIIAAIMIFIAGAAIYNLMILMVYMSGFTSLSPQFFNNNAIFCGVIFEFVVWVVVLQSSGIIKIKCKVDGKK